MELTFKAVDNVPLIQKGDDLADMIYRLADLHDNDIVVIASTIVSKSLGLTFYLSDVTPGEEAQRIARLNHKEPAFVQAVLDESLEVFVETPFMLVRNKNRHICINAGIDGSNVGGDRLLKLPENPDKHAANIGEKLEKLTGKKISVIITDTNGRAFKEGQTNVAIGLYKIKALRTWIGEKDLFGYVLEISEEAVVDEIAGAANLIMGEGANGYPVVIARGLNLYAPETAGITEFYRQEKDDVIVQGLLEIKNKGRN
ncbi:Bifunctional F420 biosynthesis protein FbiB [Methanosarcinaceae archaeon Ag5]|uniref:Bifunctional F420 biosynthesis protein FbiB n=1 Tax=Methanolapillus africanus TaxID=3028297 RepID=A0AAE4MIC9_9EURY|nr:Bifunctional F420 biosynthesis protein FbiB [Methanosarcinaceae archaeon Ag5]